MAVLLNLCAILFMHNISPECLFEKNFVFDKIRKLDSFFKSEKYEFTNSRFETLFKP